MDTYEKKYKNALTIAQSRFKIEKDESVLTCLGMMFPELRESEDERIYNEIMEFFKMNEKRCIVDNSYTRWIAWLEKQKEQIPYTDFVIKPHKGDDNNPYDMRVSEAQEYAIKRGFGVPFNDGEVYVDERHLTQTIGNILRWADEHPKEQKEPHFTKRNALFDECVEKCDTAIMKKVSDKVDEMLGKEQKPAKPQDYSGLNDLERAIHRGFLCAGVENVPVTIIKETAKDCLAQIKPTEWSEEDEDMMGTIIRDLKHLGGDMVNVKPAYKAEIDWLKSLRPQPTTNS